MQPFEIILEFFLREPLAHARWLNTLSYLEYAGARKLARFAQVQNCSEAVLKHVNEEWRHAYFLKQQIAHKLKIALPTYAPASLWGAGATLRYLDRLESSLCRHLKQQSREGLPRRTYLWMSYVIEMRAAVVYPLYNKLLEGHSSRVSVRSILREEEGHLAEMQAMLAAEENLAEAPLLLAQEQQLFEMWMHVLEGEMA